MNNRVEREQSEKAIALWWTLIAVVALVVGGLLECINAKGSVDTALHILSVMLITFGSIVASTEIGALLADKTGFIEVVKNQLADIMCNAKFISRLKKEDLLEIRRQINMQLYASKDIAFSEDSLLNSVYRSIEPHIDRYYFEKYSMDVNLKVKEDYIEKTVSRRIKIKPSGISDNQKFDIKNLFSVKIDEINRPPELKDIRINGDNVTKDFQLDDNRDEQGRHVYRLCSKQNSSVITLDKRGVSLDIIVKVFSPKNDNIFAHKMPVACKKYESTFSYRDEECSVQAVPFGFMNSERTDVEGVAVRMTDGNIYVEFSNWVLPSDGIVFSWNYK